MFGNVLALHNPLHLSRENAQLRKSISQKFLEYSEAITTLQSAQEKHREETARLQSNLQKTEQTLAHAQVKLAAEKAEVKKKQAREKSLRAEMEDMRKQHARELTRMRDQTAEALENRTLAQAAAQAAQEELAAARSTNKAHQCQYEILLRDYLSLQQKHKRWDERLRASLSALLETKRDLAKAEERLASYAEVEKMLHDTATLLLKTQPPIVE